MEGTLTTNEEERYVFGDYDPALPAMFHIDENEFDQRAQRGVGSALFRRWILSEWVDERPGELGLSNRRTSRLKEISRPIKDIVVFTAVAGSYMLDGRVPPFIK